MPLSHDPSQPASETSDQPVVEEEMLVEEELLVEDVSIDGMCGVY